MHRRTRGGTVWDGEQIEGETRERVEDAEKEKRQSEKIGVGTRASIICDLFS